METYQCLSCNLKFIRQSGPQVCKCGSVQIKWISYKPSNGKDNYGQVALRVGSK